MLATVGGEPDAVVTDAPAAHAGEEDVRRLEDMASEAPVIRLVHDVISRAVEAQASDIHIEPREDSVRVRYRHDSGTDEGTLLEKCKFGALVERDDSTIVGVSFRRLWPAEVN